MDAVSVNKIVLNNCKIVINLGRNPKFKIGKKNTEKKKHWQK